VLGEEALARRGSFGSLERPDLCLELLELLGKRAEDLLVTQGRHARIA